MEYNHSVLLKAKNIEKAFGENVVLTRAGLEVRKGEVMALLGENGAGKSTLVKIVTGVYKRDDGKIEFAGEEFPAEYDKDFTEQKGISIIYQELSVIPTLTVAQNIFLGHEPQTKFHTIDYKKMNEMVRKLIALYGFDLDPTEYVENMSIARRQVVEIMKALALDCKMIIMDEPTASLSEKEVSQLFGIIEILKKKGIGILYISHRLKEVYEIADRVTILRDGAEVAILERKEVVPGNIINLMIGRDLESSQYEENSLSVKEGGKLLEVCNLTSVGKFEEISFNLTEGEILGITGLVGAGRTEVARAIFGVDRYTSGTIMLNGKPYTPSVKNAMQNGFGFVPEDRRTQGIVPETDITKNIGITNLDLIGDAFGVSGKKELELARGMIEKMNIMPPDPGYKLIDMSGGNQQKVVVGKWLARRLKLLIVDEPTAGVDIGAKDEIYSIMQKICAQGVSIILVSSDLPEIVRLSDRILVMHNGRFVKEFNEGYVTEEDILKASSGFVEDEVAVQ